MADEAFRQTRKKITREEIMQDRPIPPSQMADPLERIKEIQEAIDEDPFDGNDQKQPSQHPKQSPFFNNPDSPLKISGNVPPAFREIMSNRTVPNPQQLNPNELAAMEGRKTVSQKAPAPPSNMRLTGSDELEKLISRLNEKTFIWEEVTLPSLGKFYDSIGATLHIRPMTGDEEYILAQQRHVKQGKAIDMIFEKCIREPIDTNQLISQDRVFLLIYLRGISYTPEYDVEVKCPECSTKFPSVINLDMNVEYCPEDFGPEALEGTLPKSGFKFKYRIATGADDQEITSYREKRAKMFGDQGEDDTLFQRMSLLIDYIEDVKEKHELKVLLRKMHVQDLNYIRNLMNDLPFGVNTKVDITCPACAHEFEIDLPMEANFFFPRKRKA